MPYSGYDFGFLLHILTAQSLPTQETDFFDILNMWFPTVFDVKYIMRQCKMLKGGLQELADDLGVSCRLTPRRLRIPLTPGHSLREQPHKTKQVPTRC